MKNIITAIGNPILNKELQKQQNIKVLTKDIKYKEELLEKIIENKNIDYLIISEFIKGRIDLIKLLNKIKIINRKIKIIIILENENNNLKEKLEQDKKYKIFIENKINIKDVIKYINNNLDNKMIVKKQIYNKIKFNNFFETMKTNIINKNYKVNKIISVIGNAQVGKTTFILIFLKLIKNKKILIIDCDFNSKEIQVILNQNKNQYNSIIKINKKIDIYNNLNKNIQKEKIHNFINKMKDEYDLIIFDCNYNKIIFEDILKISDKILFLMEPNLLSIKKSKELLKNKIRNKIELKDKIKIILNKNNIYSINKEIIESIFGDIKIIGNINYNKSYINLINNYKCFYFNKLKNRQIQKTIKKI